MRFRFLKCVATAIAKHGVRFLMSLTPGGEMIYDVAAEVWKEYHREGGNEALRVDLQELAQAPLGQVGTAVTEAVRDAAGDQPAEVQVALTNYLTQVPAAIRRSLRRPSDPSGTTFAATDTLRHADDLARFLPSRPPQFKPGARPLPGVDLELEELVGIGGFGEVWKARNPNMRNKPPVALKFCLDKTAVSALRNEVGVLDHVMKQGRHPGIVPLLQTYLSADPPFLEYEFVDGGDLAGLIHEMHARGRVKAETANRLLVRLADIVAFAHRASPPIVHGDLKPANVLVRRQPTGKVALRITDFGIGGIAAALQTGHNQRQSTSRQQLLTQAVRGAYTPLYASPQQRERGAESPPDPRDDVHALGVIWFQLLTGNLAMSSVPTDWREQAAERGLSHELVELLGRCFSSKAEKRPENAAALAERVRAASGDATKSEPETGVLVDPPPPGPQEPPGPRTTKRGHPRNARTRNGARGPTHRDPTTERTPAVRSTFGVAAVLVAGAAAAVLLAGLCTGAAWMLWPRPKAGEIPVVIAKAPLEAHPGIQPPVNQPNGRKVSSEPKPKQDAPSAAETDERAQALAELKKKEEAEKLAAKQKKEEADRLVAEQKKKDAEAELLRKAEAAKQRLAELQAKEAERKRIMDAVEDAKNKLRSKSARDRKAGLLALSKLGTDAASADYDLCQLIASDQAIRQDALSVLEKVQPKLYPLIVTLTLPPELGNKKTIKELPSFGKAGLPLIAGQLRGSAFAISDLKPHEAFYLLQADAEYLSKLAGKEKLALQLLCGMPECPLAARLLTTRPSPMGQMVADTFGFARKCRLDVANRLAKVGATNPDMRKAIVPFFVNMLTAAETRVPGLKTGTTGEFPAIAANALAGFGPDAAAALPALNDMKLHPLARVRNAVTRAIAAIEKN